jgi:serine/threonine protein kinase
MPKVIIETGDLAGRHFEIPEAGGAVTIGRSADCTIALPDSMVSRTHCSIRSSREGWTLVDEGSRNGTLVNNVEAKKVKLASGDAIRVGETLLSFQGAAADPFLGRTIAGFRIEKRLGRGASGTVYRAHQISLDRPVAFKILAPALAGDEKLVGRFLREARAAARLNHPRVVQVYDAGQEGDLYFIAMEFLEGGSLRDLLHRERRIVPDRAIAMGLEVAAALEFAEGQRIVHRDIKPANLLLDGKGALKVADLGIACDLALRSDSSFTVIGSPRYMAPEQARAGGTVDHRADIYALGATLYHAISGEPPFAGATVGEILKAKLGRDLPPLHVKTSQVPPELSFIIAKMMARSPEGRYGSAADVRAALARASSAMAARRKRAVEPVRGKARSLPSWLSVGLTVLGIVLAVAAFLAFLSMFRR